VLALLSGRKKQHRELVVPQTAILTDEMARGFGVRPPVVENMPVIECPYGKLGDLLWVQEPFQASNPHVDRLSYQATETNSKVLAHRWLSPESMPFWASRITLEITNVRVERLQDISEEDAIVEGARDTSIGTEWEAPPGADYVAGPRTWFAILWNKTNTHGSWRENPWVWVLEFNMYRCNVGEFYKSKTGRNLPEECQYRKTLELLSSCKKELQENLKILGPDFAGTDYIDEICRCIEDIEKNIEYVIKENN